MLGRKPPATRRTSDEVDDIVLAVLDSANEPLSAYDLAEQAARTGASLAPAQIYRALGRLISRDAACRIESLSAYVRSRHAADYVAVCTRCHRSQSARAPDLPTAAREAAAGIGFAAERVVVEVIGLCPECRRATEKH